jgi:hypothetical protein
MRFLQQLSTTGLTFTLALTLAAGCADDQADPTAPRTPSFDEVPTALVPAGLVTVAFAGWQAELWPFTGNGIGTTPNDPINAIFPNRDAREIRASLMALDGNRTAFGMPNAAPFNCTWKDAVGDAQVGYTTEAAWNGSVIQLECGDYAPMRFHIRLMPGGSATLANGHFEVIVPGTNQHEVLSWELAEQLLKVDMMRSGLLDPAAPLTMTAQITPSPTYRTINPLIYNGLPVALRGLIGGPLGNSSTPVPMPNDGRAVVFNMTSARTAPVGATSREFAINFNQTIPKPFCSTGPLDYLRVTGVVTINQTVETSARGDYSSYFKARGTLNVIEVNPVTGALGASYQAAVSEQQSNVLNDDRAQVSAFRLQKLISPDRPLQSLTVNVDFSHGVPRVTVQEVCPR